MIPYTVNRALLSWMNANDASVHSIATRTDTTIRTVECWLDGRELPDARQMLILSELTGKNPEELLESTRCCMEPPEVRIRLTRYADAVCLREGLCAAVLVCLIPFFIFLVVLLPMIFENSDTVGGICVLVTLLLLPLLITARFVLAAKRRKLPIRPAWYLNETRFHSRRAASFASAISIPVHLLPAILFFVLSEVRKDCSTPAIIVGFMLLITPLFLWVLVFRWGSSSGIKRTSEPRFAFTGLLSRQAVSAAEICSTVFCFTLPWAVAGCLSLPLFTRFPLLLTAIMLLLEVIFLLTCVSKIHMETRRKRESDFFPSSSFYKGNSMF